FYPIYSVFGASPADSNAAVVNSQINFPMKGKNFFRLGSPSSNPTRTERITKTFTVTSTNYLLDIAFIALLSRGHWCCDAAMFRVFIDNNQCSVIYSAASANNNCYVNKGMQFYLV